MLLPSVPTTSVFFLILDSLLITLELGQHEIRLFATQHTTYCNCLNALQVWQPSLQLQARVLELLRQSQVLEFGTPDPVPPPWLCQGSMLLQSEVAFISRFPHLLNVQARGLCILGSALVQFIHPSSCRIRQSTTCHLPQGWRKLSSGERSCKLLYQAEGLAVVILTMYGHLAQHAAS